MQNIQAKLIAFYLPQFHPTPENSEWWGPGFTEWTNVAKSSPLFEGHYQPHVPRELGFYDLRLTEVMQDQAALAAKYGVHGFCFYYYWFAGRRILETPLNNWLRAGIDFPYCVCWANENWTRRWDGGKGEVLLEQHHSEADFRAFFAAVRPHLEDPRYLRVEGKPVLIVYRPTLFPDPLRAADIWREEARAAGIGELHLCTVQFYGITDPRPLGFDAAIEFPPHTFMGSENVGSIGVPLPPGASPAIVDYRKVIAQSLAKTDPDYPVYRGIVPSWDNTPRRRMDPMIMIKSTPELFRYWLTRLVHAVRERPADKRLIFVNAWNEWGEGCHLEPDLKHGLQYLEACLASVTTNETQFEVENAAVIDQSRGLQTTITLSPFQNERLAGEIRDANAERESMQFEGNVVSRLAAILRRSAPWLFPVARSAYRALRRVWSR